MLRVCSFRQQVYDTCSCSCCDVVVTQTQFRPLGDGPIRWSQANSWGFCYSRVSLANEKAHPCGDAGLLLLLCRMLTSLRSLGPTDLVLFERLFFGFSTKIFLYVHVCGEDAAIPIGSRAAMTTAPNNAREGNHVLSCLLCVSFAPDPNKEVEAAGPPTCNYA